MADHVDIEMRVADLRGRVMSAVLGETCWSHFLDGLRDLLPNGAATLFYHDTAIDRGAFSLASGMSDAAQTAYADHFSSLNPWMEAATRRPIGLAVPDSAMFCRDALQKTEFYNDYLAPNDLRGAVGITIDRRESCHFFLSVLADSAETAERRDALTVLKAVAPDLRRAFAFYQRQPPASPVSAADETKRGFMIIGPGRHLRSTSGLADACLASGEAVSAGPTGRVDFLDKRISSFIDGCLRAACTRSICPVPGAFLTAPANGAPLKITVMTWPWAEGMRFFKGPECVVLIEAGRRSHPDMAEVVHLYRLTPAETRVAEGLMAGLSPHDVAGMAGVSFETVRSHLRSLFAKTDTHRQPELVIRLMTLAG